MNMMLSYIRPGKILFKDAKIKYSKLISVQYNICKKLIHTCLFQFICHFSDCCRDDGCHDVLVDGLIKRVLSVVGEENFTER